MAEFSQVIKYFAIHVLLRKLSFTLLQKICSEYPVALNYPDSKFGLGDKSLPHIRP